MRILLFFIVMCVFSTSAAVDIYHCGTDSTQLSFQDFPCSGEGQKLQPSYNNYVTRGAGLRDYELQWLQQIHERNQLKTLNQADRRDGMMAGYAYADPVQCHGARLHLAYFNHATQAGSLNLASRFLADLYDQQYEKLLQYCR